MTRRRLTEAAALIPGDTVTVVGERGSFGVRRVDERQQVTVWGGMAGHEMYRTFAADRRFYRITERQEK